MHHILQRSLADLLISNSSKFAPAICSLHQLKLLYDGFHRSIKTTAYDLPDDLLPKVAIVGRPNVGKSALFNRMIKKRKSIVYNTPAGHVTRDYQEAPATIGDLNFIAIDTSGMEPFLPEGTIQARATALTNKVLKKSDVALLLLDGRSGISPLDQSLATWLRSTACVADKILLAANKCEGNTAGSNSTVSATLNDAYRLGFGEAVAISAETGEGMVDLYEVLQEKLDPIIQSRRALIQEVGGGDSDSDSDELVEKVKAKAAIRKSKSKQKHSVSEAAASIQEKPVKIAIMGLVNVGKSTLTNHLIKEERCLTGPEPGLTRDAITTHLQWNMTQGSSSSSSTSTTGTDNTSSTVVTREIELVDTAGWVRKARLSAHDESGGAVAARTLEEGRTVLRFVHVVILVVDALRIVEHNEGFTHAEATLAGDVVNEGRSLVLAVNKLDAVTPTQRAQAVKLLTTAAEQALPGVAGVSILGVSALTGHGVDALIPSALKVYETWNKRVPTSALNKWLKDAIAQRPVGGGSELQRVKFLSQVKARPPRFVAFVSGSNDLKESTQRYLINLIRDRFGFGGVPIAVTYRKKEKFKVHKQRGGSRKPRRN